jgi:putative Holliday junction resolvase
MKYLGLDLGSKTCGIAISSGIIASIYETFRFNEDDYDTCLNHIVEVVNKEKIDEIVLGYPKHMNNDIGIRAKISEDFKAKLEEKISAKVILWDERTTSMEVNRVMLMNNTSRKKRKEHKDELAAVIILQGYLDYKN